MKALRIYIALVFIICSAGIYGQSMNCATATQLNLNNGTVCVNGTNAGAVTDNILYGGCNASPVDMVWYTYITNGSNNSFTVIPGTLQNAEIVIYQGGCPGTGTLQTCTTAVGGNSIGIPWGMTAGTQVWVGIASTSLNDGTFQLCINSQPPAPGAGNVCATAIPVCSTVFSQPVIPSNSSGQLPNCFASAPQQDLFIKFTIKQAGSLAWTAMPVNLTTEFDWCLWDITGGCPGLVACCNYNYAAGSSLGFGMQNSAGNVPCGYNLATGIPAREFCPTMNVTCGQIFAIQISNYSNDNTGFNLNFSNSTCLIASTSSFVVTPTLMCGPSLSVNINNLSTGACGGEVWSFGDGSPNYNGLIPPSHTYTTPGTYAITASIPGVCPSATTQFVQLLAPLAATVTSANIPCSGQCSGTAGISSVTGGNGVYTYLWSNGATTSSVGGLCAGNYSVTITNTLCGSSITRTVSITAPPALSISATAFSTTCGTANGSITVSGSGGTPTYSYSINGGAYTAAGTFTGLIAGTYTMAVIDQHSCTVTAVVTVTQTPPPVISVNSATVCPGAPAALSASGAVTYSWGPAGGLNTTTGPNVIATVTAPTTYTVFGTAAGCTGTATAVVSINPLPNPVANVNPVCAGQSVTFNGAGGTTYTWTGPGGFSSNSQNPVIAVVQASNAGVYTLNVSNAFGCSNSTTVNLVVNAPPVITVNNPTVCVNQNINLTASGGTAYTWAGPSAYTSNVQNPVIANAQLNMSGGYTVTVTSAAGCTNTAVANVNVITLPNPSITSNTPCAGTTLSLTGTGGTAYSWSGPNGFNSILQNPNITNVTLAAGGVYTLIATIGTCSNSVTGTIAINPLPTPTATSNSPVCQLQAINFTGLGGTTYTWTGPGLNSNLQNALIPVAQMSNSATYTLTVTDVNGCVNSAATNVTVNPIPVITVNNPTACTGANVGLTSTGGVSYSWSGPLGYTSNLQNPVIANAQPGMSGGYTVTVTSASGCTNAAVAQVSVVTSPSPTAGSNGPVCVGQTLQFNSGGGTAYSWTGPNGFSSNLQNPTITNIQAIQAGVYTVIATVNTCTGTATVSVVINPLPTPTIVSNSPVCLLQQLTFTALGGVTYTWSGPGGFTSNSQNPTIAAVQNTNAGVYTLSVSDANSCTNTVSATVNINPSPNITANGATSCSNAPINLTSGGGTTYTWSGPGGFTSSLQNPVIASASMSNAGQYTVVGSNVQGCTGTAVCNVVVVPQPQPTITANDVCIGATLIMSASGGNSYLWSGPNSFTSASSVPSIPNAQLSASGIYTLVATVGICSGTTTASITVHPLPTPTLSSNSPVCRKDEIIFSASGGNLYSWIGPAGFSGQGNSPVIQNAALSNAGTYTATATDQYGCQSTATINVIVNDLPLVGVSGSTLCATQTIILQASGGTAYQWAGPGGFTNTSATVQIPGASTVMAGDYTVTVTGSNNCTNTGIASVSINPVPDLVLTSNAPICINSTLHLTANAPTAVQYFWTGPNSFITPQQNPDINNVDLNASGQYTASASDQIGCTATAVISVTIRPSPVLNLVSDKLSSCVPLCVNLAPATNTDLVSLLWDFGNGSTGAGMNVNMCYNNAGSYLVNGTCTDRYGCKNAASLLLHAWPIPVADFNFEPDEPITNDNIIFKDASYGANVTQWNWFFSDTKDQVWFTQNVNRSYEDAGAYTGVLIAISDHGCWDTIVKPIIVGEDFGIWIPNAFTPNGDGLNDTFQPKGYGITDYQMMIFDRWGEKLYQTKDFYKGWDGFFRSQLCKEDTYVWKISVSNRQGKSKELCGIVTLIR